MHITFISIGKTSDAYLKEPCAMYAKRIVRYTAFTWKETADVKSLPPDEMRLRESEAVKKLLEPGDHIVLLDERGTHHTSRGFAGMIAKKQAANVKRLVFVLGGAHGFADSLYAMANEKLSLSPLTFPHQMVRLIFLEQLYRAFTILQNEPYHH